MRAITLWEPWACLCVLPAAGDVGRVSGVDPGLEERTIGRAVKTIETRSWPAPRRLVGERLAIHAAVRRPPAEDLAAVNPALAAHGYRFERDGRAAVLRAGDMALPLAFGAVLGTARLAACVPMVAHPTGDDCLVVDDSGLWVDGPAGRADVSDQAPFGWFEAGRWAWILADVVAFATPVPARGSQGLWNWPPPPG